MKTWGIGSKIGFVAMGALLMTACAHQAATTTTTTAPATVNGPPPGSQADFMQNVGDRVFFDYDRYDIKEEGRSVLQRQAAFLKMYAKYTVTVEGHCDERGTREYNLALGSRRASAVKDYLVSLGIDGARLATISYGKERPVCVESSEDCWGKNRRGVSVLGQKSPGT
jgi:peptidoglycan-associated lipoprotein